MEWRNWLPERSADLDKRSGAYPSPLLVLCDSPQNYRGQPGIEFLRAIPTVWDDTLVLEGDVANSIAVARRSGKKWYLVAMNGEANTQLQAPLKFLGKGKWTLHAFADKPDSSDDQAVVETTLEVDAKTVVPLLLMQAGGFAGIISKAEE